MTCEEVRERLPEHLLGTLADIEDAAVRKHLRGCGVCRADLAALADGMDAFALAAHDADPPAELEARVLEALAEEWAEDSTAGSSSRAPLRRTRGKTALSWLAAAAAVLLIAASIGVAVSTLRRAGRAEAEAAHSRRQAAAYDNFLGVLGGENVRVGSIRPASSAALEGSVVVYDSKEGQSWVLVLLRAPGEVDGPIRAVLADGSGHTIALRPMTVDPNGEASTFLVTSSNLRDFSEFTLTGPGGDALATGTLSS